MRDQAYQALAQRIYVETTPGGGCEISHRERVSIGGWEHTVTVAAHGATVEEAVAAWEQLVGARGRVLASYRNAREGRRDRLRDLHEQRDRIVGAVIEAAASDLEEAAKWGWDELSEDEGAAFRKAAARLRTVRSGLVSNAERCVASERVETTTGDREEGSF